MLPLSKWDRMGASALKKALRDTVMIDAALSEANVATFFNQSGSTIASQRLYSGGLSLPTRLPWASARALLAALLDSPHRTGLAEEADYFFIPIRDTTGCWGTDQMTWRAHRYISQTWPFWNASKGGAAGFAKAHPSIRAPYHLRGRRLRWRAPACARAMGYGLWATGYGLPSLAKITPNSPSRRGRGLSDYLETR